MKSNLPENTELSRKQTDNKKKKRFGSAASWVLIAAAVLIIVPVGCIMFMLSGLWSAADKVLGKAFG